MTIEYYAAPGDRDVTNSDRAIWGKAALEGYCIAKGEDDVLNDPIDLMADLMHYLNSLGVDPVRAVEIARGHYLEEAE